MMGDYSIFFTRPVSLILLVLALVSFAWPIMSNRILKKKAMSN